MNLICPHCQKLVTIGDELAGQTTTCPQCRGPFTVPLPPRPADVPAPSPPPPPALPPPLPELSAALETPSPPVPPPPSGEYGRRLGFTLQPRIVRWIAPACFVLIFVLMFFPWVGVYHGSYTAARQLGFGVVFGVYDGPNGKDSLEEKQRPGVSPFTLLYFLLLLGALAATAGLVVLTLAPHVIPPHIVQKVVPWRTLALAGLSLLGLVLLLPQIFLSLPFESRVLEEAEKKYEAALAATRDLKEAREASKADAKIRAEIEYGNAVNAVQRRTAFRLVVLLNLIAVAGALADLWLDKRPGRPLPRVSVEW
jgi:hypothetical protein